jgi:hypothetical protein
VIGLITYCAATYLVALGISFQLMSDNDWEFEIGMFPMVAVTIIAPISIPFIVGMWIMKR